MESILSIEGARAGEAILDTSLLLSCFLWWVAHSALLSSDLPAGAFPVGPRLGTLLCLRYCNSPPCCTASLDFELTSYLALQLLINHHGCCCSCTTTVLHFAYCSRPFTLRHISRRGTLLQQNVTVRRFNADARGACSLSDSVPWWMMLEPSELDRISISTSPVAVVSLCSVRTWAFCSITH